MPADDQDEPLRTAWQEQQPRSSLTAADVRKGIVQMEKTASRTTYSLYTALMLSASVVTSLAFLFANALLVVGAAMTVCGLAFLGYEIVRHRRHVPAVSNGAIPSVEFQRALLQHQLEFHRKRLWLRVMAMAPGGVLFFAGFAMARPDLAPFIYLQLATFLAAMVMVVPANRRTAAKLKRQIDELERLR